MKRKIAGFLFVTLLILLWSACGRTIIGNNESKIIHYSDCDYVKRMKNTHKVHFRNIQEGLKYGYKKCEVCMGRD